MVRTKADAGLKVSAAKAPRKGLAPSSAGSSNSPKACSSALKDKYSGGNMLNAQPTPDWQKGITTFFKKKENSVTDKKELEDKSSSVEEGSSSPNSEKEITKETSEEKEDSMEVDDSSENKENKTEFQSNGMISDDE